MSIIGVRHSKHLISDSVACADNIGFVPDVTGVLNCQLKGDAIASLLPVIAGVFYPFSIILAKATDTTGVTYISVIGGRGA